MTLVARDDALVELMDDPHCDPVRLDRTLRRFRLLNRLLAGWGTVYEAEVRPALVAGGGRGRLLDIGCGGGDVLRRLVTRARGDGFTVEAVGIDPDERGLAVARATPVTGIRYRSALSADLVAEGERFDVVVSNHLLHHLTAEQLAGLARDSEALASRVALHSDIVRGRTAYCAYAVAITPLAPGTFLRTDGLLSIRRSYTPGELRDALPGWTVFTPMPFRLVARWRAGADGGAHAGPDAEAGAGAEARWGAGAGAE